MNVCVLVFFGLYLYAALPGLGILTSTLFEKRPIEGTFFFFFSFVLIILIFWVTYFSCKEGSLRKKIYELFGYTFNCPRCCSYPLTGLTFLPILTIVIIPVNVITLALTIALFPLLVPYLLVKRYYKFKFLKWETYSDYSD